MVYLINYDLDEGTDEEYQDIENRLTELGAKRVLLSQWALDSPLTATELWRRIEDLFLFDRRVEGGVGDRLLIAAISLSRTRTTARNLITKLDTL